jgi:peptidoglycan/LPS O-acetylase OafA/YrhL
MATPQAQRGDGYLVGLDVVRACALGLVTAQHVLEFQGHEPRATWAGLSLGQLGVALFFAVSGLLASASRRPPLPWLFQRFQRVFPAYWIAVSASFFLAWLIGHKPFGASQVLAQLCGVGLFTHRDNLVNAPTWFVSLLLVCYTGTCLARLARAPLLLGACCALALAVVVEREEKPWLSSHLLTYALASTLALAPPGRRAPLAVVLRAALFALAFWLRAEFAYTAVALTWVGLSLGVRRAVPLLHLVTESSYEYYLVHGVVLFGIIRWWPSSPLAAAGCAIGLSAVAAVALRWTVFGLGRLAARKAGAAPSEGQALIPAGGAERG